MAATGKVVDMSTRHKSRNEETELVKLLDRTIEADSSYVEPIPTNTLNRMARIRKKLAEARQRVFQEEM